MPQISTYTLSFTGSSQDIKDTKTTIDETLNVQDSYYSYDNIVTVVTTIGIYDSYHSFYTQLLSLLFSCIRGDCEVTCITTKEKVIINANST